MLIKNSARDMTVVVRSTLEVVLSHLEQSFAAQILSAEDRDRVQGLQSLLCGNIQVRAEAVFRAEARCVGSGYQRVEAGLCTMPCYSRMGMYAPMTAYARDRREREGKR